MEMFFLSYANETMYLLWNLPFFKMVPPKTELFFFFFLFSNLGLIAAQKSVFASVVLWLGDDAPHAILSKRCTLWKRGLVKLLQPYLINSFLTDIKQLAKTSRGALSVPLLMSMSETFSVLFHFNKTLLHKSSSVIKPGLWS